MRKFMELKDKKLFLFDIDGTLALGNDLFDGAKELIELLYQTGRAVYYTSNNSTRSQKDYVKYFAQWGIETREEEFLTAGYMGILYCSRHLKGRKVYLIGTPSYAQSLREAGVWVTEQYEEDVACVLVAFDTTLHFGKLETACRLLQNKKVLFVATNPDLCCPVSFGAVPDCGSICMMLQNATGRTPLYLGKPAADIAEVCRKVSGCTRKETVLVGDRIYTDMLCAANAGIDSVLVLTGEATREDAQKGETKVTYVMDSVKDLISAVRC